MIPHFEKMLYDNAQLLSRVRRRADVRSRRTFRGGDRRHHRLADRARCGTQDGAFYAALDADSEGEEGKFYVWRREQVKKLLSEDEYLVVETLYGLDKPANFESKWNLHRYDSWRSVVKRLSLQSR